MTLLVAIRSREALILASDTAESLKTNDGVYLSIRHTARKIYPVFRADHDGHRPALAIMHTGDCRLLEMPVEEALRGYCRAVADRKSPFYQPRNGFNADAVSALLGCYLSEHHVLTAERQGWSFSATFLIAGWGQGNISPTISRLCIHDGIVLTPQPELTTDRSLFALGQSLAVSRLIGSREQEGEAYHQFSELGEGECVQMARYLMDVGKGWSRFFSPAPTVGGQVTLATLGPMSGFEWVQQADRYGKQRW